MQRSKPKVGQIIYSLNIGNEVSKYSPQELTEVVVRKVGRKYFYAGRPDWPERMDKKYFISSWSQQNGGYMPTSALYETQQEWLDEKEKNDLFRMIRKDYFSTFREKDINLEKLRKIRDILDEE